MKSLLRGIKLILTLDCEGSARLTSEGFDRKLSIYEKLAIRAHNSMCKKSRKLARQLKRLHQTMLSKESSDCQPLGMSAEAKTRIQQVMEKELG